MSTSQNPGPPPPRWKKCPRKSEQLVGGKFLAMKTPLDKRFDPQIPPECRFPPSFVFQSMKSYELKIGLWIDLCNTSRFYRQKEIEEAGARYVKLQCRGHGETPSRNQVEEFIYICRSFALQNPSEIIAIHCTHGFNRTGFMICSFFVETEDWSIEAAVLEFAKLRKPGIYKADYIEELFRRYGDVSETLAAPELPSWCHEEDDACQNLDDDGCNLEVAEKSRHRKKQNKRLKTVFMEGVPGVTPFHEEPHLSELQERLNEMCEAKTSGFPGSQPVSLDCENISLISKMAYRVSWKADGTRYMMLIAGNDQVYFIDRDNAFFKVSNLKFINRKNPREHLKDTLLDGEMVIDEVGDKRFPRYLVYDIVIFEGKQVGKTDFLNRITCISKEIVGARNTCIKNGLIDKRSEPFSIRLKEFWDLNETRKLLGPKFTKESLGHEPDGIIFQPIYKEYISGTDYNILKWKPLSLNSVDFKLIIGKEDRPGMLVTKIGYLFVGGYKDAIGQIKVTKALLPLNKKIIECSWSFEKKDWVFMRERTDKSSPNHYQTAKAVIKSISQPVTEKFLLDYIDRYSWKRPVVDHEDFPPPHKVPRHV